VSVTSAAAVNTGVAPGRFLYGLNPLAKIAAVLPAMVLVLVTRGVPAPLALVALGVIILVVGARLRPSTVIALFVVLPIAVGILTVAFGLWVDPSRIHDHRAVFTIGAFPFTRGALAVGLASALRLAALVVLALIGGLTTQGADMARALVQQLRLPYRISYTAIAAYRFIPRLRGELLLIRRAQRVRGTSGGWGVFASVRRALAALIPLLASAIRHADRMALAMESRAFGAHPSRTERRSMPWRRRDTVFVLVVSLASVAIVVTTSALVR